MNARRITAIWVLGCVLVGQSGCAEDSASADDFMDEDFPPWSCDSDTSCTSSGASEGAPAPACQSSNECSGGEICAADFDGDIGSFSCQAVCIVTMDDAQWCADDSACCDPLAVCTRGYCLPGEAGSSSDDGNSGSGTDDGGTSSGGGSSG
ncbi:MAG: hypothetical protein IAG13_06395 [Deltaproteobacteria bacterium]|nr:hypothetical protein [Nannocystaceae bacterium]